MYQVTKRLEISASHKLDLPYESKCKNSHGHNWLVKITVHADTLTDYGMVLDFVHIKKLIHDKLDHQDMNSILKVNPTAENIAYWIQNEINDYLAENEPDRIVYVSEVEVQESEGNVAKWSI